MLRTRIINNDQKISIRRLLPSLGQVLVQKGQKISALDTVARAESPSRYYVIEVAKKLAKPDINMDKVLLKSEGDVVEAGELIAVRKNRITFLQKTVSTPIKGLIVAIGQGWVLLETQRTVTQVQAFINGTVTRVIANRGVIMEANGTIVEAACGFGEAHGLFKRLVDAPDESITADDLDLNLQNTIILAGQSVDEAVLRKADEVGVRGLVVGSIDATLRHLNPPPKVCVVATEGFGEIPMSLYTFGILKNLQGRDASIRGIMPTIASPDELPVILAPTGKPNPPGSTDEPKKIPSLAIGNYVRITRGEFMGKIASVESLPIPPRPCESGIVVPVASLMIEGIICHIPLVNLEQIL